MDDQIVQPDRCHVVTHRLQRHSAVPERELDLLDHERAVGGLHCVGVLHDRKCPRAIRACQLPFERSRNTGWRGASATHASRGDESFTPKNGRVTRVVS
jgi:hypothetical protein